MIHEEVAPCVFIYDDVYSQYSSERFIELLNTECEKDSGYLMWLRAQVGDGYISDIRTSMTCELEPLNASNIQDNDVLEIANTWKDIFEKVDKTVWDYREKNELDLSADESYRVLKYGSGAEYRAHHDHGPGNRRVMSLVSFLNDDFTGGELVFPKFDLEIKPKAGRCVLFPSNFPYMHIAMPVGVDDGTVKYSLVTWFS
jgi:hypothetical protein